MGILKLGKKYMPFQKKCKPVNEGCRVFPFSILLKCKVLLSDFRDRHVLPFIPFASEFNSPYQNHTKKAHFSQQDGKAESLLLVWSKNA